MTIYAKDRYRLSSGRILSRFGSDFPKSCITDTERGGVYTEKPYKALEECEKYSANIICSGHLIAVCETQAEADALVNEIAEHMAAGRLFVEITAGRITKSY
jgi:hypothetical protein